MKTKYENHDGFILDPRHSPLPQFKNSFQTRTQSQSHHYLLLFNSTTLFIFSEEPQTIVK